MRSLRWLGLFVVLTIAPSVWKNDSSPAADAFVQKDLVIHEWGVLSAYPDVETANADMRDEWDALPKFVFGRVEGKPLPNAGIYDGPVRLPVIHIYSPDPVDVNVRVDFPPTGKPLVWWPENVNNNPDYQNGRSKLRGNFLEWQVQVRAPQAGNVQMLPLPTDHWMNALRSVKCEEFTVSGINGRLAAREKFLYYDGTVPSPKPLEVVKQKDQWIVKNRSETAVFDVTVVDRRTAGKVLIARLTTLEGNSEKALTFGEVDAKEFADKAVETLASQLKTAGLFEDESKVVANIWKKALFEAQGVTTSYRLAQSEYDRILPLTVNPRPEKVVRVLLMHQPHCEPELAELVQKLIEQLSAKEFAQRVVAQKQLSALGKAALPFLARALKDTSDPEVRARLTKLLEDFTIKLTAVK